jgi:hypothetical protein
MFVSQQHTIARCLRWLIVLLLIDRIDNCQIWKASDCPSPPTADDEEIVHTTMFMFISSIQLFIVMLSSLNTISIHASNCFNFAIKESDMPNVLTNVCNVAILKVNIRAH